MDYDDGSLSSTEGVAAGLRATWNITRLTTITAVIDRQVEATTVDEASSRFDTLGELRVDHEQRRDLIVRAEEHTSELQSLMRISYAVVCDKNKKRSAHT